MTMKLYATTQYLHLQLEKQSILNKNQLLSSGKSTLNRLEHCPENVSSRIDSRYHRIEQNAEAIKTLLVELFLESYGKPPRQIILDLDVTDDLIHGNQEETFFNPYYRGYCYAPLYIFCGKCSKTPPF